MPAIVEGPQLMRELSEPLSEGHGAWLIPHCARTRAAREQRLEVVALPAARERLEQLLERDAVLAARTRQAAEQLGRPLIEVPAAPDWGSIHAAVERFLATALRPRRSPVSGEVLHRAVAAAHVRGVRGPSTEHLLLAVSERELPARILVELGVPDVRALVDTTYPVTRPPVPQALVQQRATQLAATPDASSPRTCWSLLNA
ncbi:MAG: hypothetical protein ACRDQ1_18080 [Sciscionella sp.]